MTEVKGMSLIVKTITRLIMKFIFLWGLYIVINGHLTPGGGFAGGVIIAGSFVLVLLAFGIEGVRIKVEKWRAAILESAGIFLFWLLAITGIFTGASFFLNFISKVNPGQPMSLFSAGIIPLCNIGIGIEVGAALFSIVIALAVLGKEEEQ